ncbi:UNVERIFIED_CONTAM: hypothetical protein HDU68_008216 [Siphonaria sp. JEL0065]|nr:hypothetical protein HDU68_008216 [Siphonaria sp. JEL0065]
MSSIEFDAALTLAHMNSSPSNSPTPSYNSTPSMDCLPTPPPLFLEDTPILIPPPFKLTSSPIVTTFAALSTSKSRFFLPPTKGHVRATKTQLIILEAIFEETPAPSAAMFGAISDRIGMSLNATRNWFQNRRAKARKEKAAAAKVTSSASVSEVASVIPQQQPTIVLRTPIIPSSPEISPIIRKSVIANVMSISALI